MAQVRPNIFDISKYYPQHIRDKEIKPFQERADEAATEVVLSEDKSGAMKELQTLVTAMQNNIRALSSDKISIFNEKSSKVITNDLGNGEDYVSVHTTKEAAKSQVNLVINEVARAASLTVETKVAGVGFTAAEDISVTVGGVNPRINVGIGGPGGGFVTVNLAANDTIANVATKINAALQGSLLAPLNKMQATVSKGIGDSYSLVVKSNNTGAGVINVTLLNNAGNYGANEALRVDGRDSQITLDGVVKTSSTANFTETDLGIKGLSLSIKKPNTTGVPAKNISIEITENSPKVIEVIKDFITNYNNFLKFSSIQSETVKKGNTFVFTEDAKLGDTSSLRKAGKLYNIILDKVKGLTGTTHLFDIGFGFNTPYADANGIPYKDRKFDIQDNNKFYDFVVNKFEDVRKIFQTSISTVNVLGNAASLSFRSLANNSNIPDDVAGVNIQLDDDGAGNITFTVPGQASQNAVLIGDTLSFPGTKLKDINLKYLTTPGAIKQFTFNVSVGVADKFNVQVSKTVSEIDSEFKQIDNRTTNLKAKETKLKADLANEQKRINDLVLKLELMALRFENEMDRYDLMAESFRN